MEFMLIRFEVSKYGSSKMICEYYSREYDKT